MIAIVISVVLVGGGMAIINTTSNSARVNTAQERLVGFATSMEQVLLESPELMGSMGNLPNESDPRFVENAGLEKAIARMNTLIGEDSKFEWNNTRNVYVSKELDPWGEPYILDPSTKVKLDYGTKKHLFRATFWSCGKSGSILDPNGELMEVVPSKHELAVALWSNTQEAGTIKKYSWGGSRQYFDELKAKP